MPNIKIEGSTQNKTQWIPQTGTLITNTKTTEIYLVGKQFCEIAMNIILINLRTGFWHYWKADFCGDYELLDPNYKVTMSNGQLDDE